MHRSFRLIPNILLCAVLVWCVSVQAAPPDEPSTVHNAASLLALRTEHRTQLQGGTFGEPLHLASHDTGSRLQADVFAELGAPFATVSSLLSGAESVCGVLFLHLNVRACDVQRSAQGDVLMVTGGPKQGTVAGATTYSMAYTMRVESASADYLRVTLVAASGPLSTADYRIVFEATPLAGQRTFLHFAYGYSYGGLAKMALNIYLATAGRTKIGFSVVGKTSDGKPQYVQGERASVERNVMRNYLALRAYTAVQSGTPAAQMDARLRAWFALTERYSAQLHELTLEEYLSQKSEDLARAVVAQR